MRDFIFYLILSSITAIFVSTCLNSVSEKNQTTQFIDSLKPIVGILPISSNINFEPSDSIQLYYLTQFALSPRVVSSNMNLDTTLILSKSVYIPNNYERIIIQYESQGSFVCLKSLKQ